MKAPGAVNFGPPQYVKLPPHFDMTGVCAFTQLQSDTISEYRAGWFFAETELDNLDATQDLDWSNAVRGTFRTGTDDRSKGRSYVIGSCRYLLKLFGGLILDDRGDKTFNSILKQISNRPIDGLLMIGDQIYADDLNFLAPDVGIDQFLDRYRSTFSQPSLRQLMSQVPTYMILDDHEIEDNWPTKASEKDKVILYPAAMHSYQIYQCSHSPLFGLDQNNRLAGTVDRFWYVFKDGCCDWFVMDVRTERVWNDDHALRRMVSDEQMAALLDWLADGSGLVKLIVTSVPFFPDLKSDSQDKWTGFVLERTKILDFILAKKIRKVVFVSGDVHCSMSAELRTPQDPNFQVMSVISSSFFWPYPHMDPGGFVLSGKLQSAASANEYEIAYPSELHLTDNFGRLDITPAGIDISFFERKGAPLGSTVQRFF